MRLVLCKLALSTFFLVGLQATAGEETRLKAVSPRPQVTILCRWIDGQGNLLLSPKLTVPDGQKGFVADTTQSPFVVGVTPVGEEGKAQQPNIVVLDEGTRVEVAIKGRLAHGASVDVIVERSKITEVGTKQIVPNETTIQVPRVELHKQRVFDFLKFGEVLAIPIGEKGANGIVPRIELTIGAGNEVNLPTAWTSPVERENLPQHAADANRHELLGVLLLSGGATIRCQQVSCWEKARGRRLYDDLEDLRLVYRFVEPYRYSPHPLGLTDALCFLSPAIHDPDCIRRLEMLLTGCDWVYSVELADHPSLRQNVQLLRGLPEVWNLTVQGKQCDYHLMHYLTKINVLHNLGMHEQPRRTVMSEDAQPERIGVTFDDAVTFEAGSCAWRITHPGPGFPTLDLVPVEPAVFTVFVDDANAAVPALKTTNKWKQVLIIGDCDEDVQRANQAAAMMQKALPNMEVSTFVFTGTKKNGTRKNAQQAAGAGMISCGIPRIIVQKEGEGIGVPDTP